MRGIFPDWRSRGQTSMLHEHESGFAFNKPAIRGIADKARGEGVRIATGVQVKEFHTDSSGAVLSVDTNHGKIEVDQIVVAVGPWIGDIWTKLGLPDKIDVLDLEGNLAKERNMWTYWRLQEGEIRVDPSMYVTADGAVPPVFHFDSAEPLVSLKTGEVITDGLWGTYWKQDLQGVQGGATPENLGPVAQVDPYGPDSPLYTVKDDFVDLWTSSLSHAMERFQDCHHQYHHAPTGGIGCFTPDNFPVFDHAPGIPNMFIVADSNHGFKMVSVGKEVARVLLGETSAILHPFRLARFAEGDLHPVSNSPYIWG
jgi:glycine/D-amino acid oxidase-like deaminating enzyme